MDDKRRRFADESEEYTQMLIAYFTKRQTSYEESRELTQTVLSRALKGLENFRGDTDLKTWVFGIARRTFCNFVRDRDVQRRRGRVISLDGPVTRCGEGHLADIVEDPNVDGPHDQLVEREAMRRLEKALQELSPRQRRCLMLRFHQNLPYKDIATLMRISPGTVKSTLAKAREKLKALMGDFAPDEGSQS